MSKQVKMLELFFPGLIGIAFLILIPYQVSSSSLAGDIRSTTLFPNVIAWVLILLSGYQTVKHLFKREADGNELSYNINKKVIWGFIIFLIFIILIPILGLLISSCLNIYLMIYVLGKTKWYRALIFSVVFSFVVWFGFKYLLHIPFPEGYLGL